MPKKVLVIDDDPSQCRCMAIGLRVEGFEVIEALSGAQALEGLNQSEVDAAVVDLMMPGMNGLEMCRLLKEKFPRMGVVLTSAYHLSQRQLELAGIGHAVFIGKPFTMEKLARLVRQRLEVVDATPTPAAAAR
jgi:DNA-binding response OmpR family regulator